MENTPEAAAPATEAQPTNNTPEAPAQTSVEASKDAPATNDLGLTAEQTAEFKKFVEANGGFEKSFKTFKERISNPVQDTPKEEAKAPEQSAQAQNVQEEHTQRPQTPAGYMSQQEFMAQQYYNSLANQDEFAPIADKIRSGEVFSEMRKFGIRPMDEEGNINDVQAREFLSLLAKTVPAKPANDAGEAAAPTVDYIPTNGGKIDSFEQATRIINQSERLRSQNLAEHPDLAAAKEFIKNALTSKKK